MDQAVAAGIGGAVRFPRARIGVSLLFFMNGFTVGSWAPKIPEFAARLGLSESQLGMMIVAFGVGSLMAMPAVGAMVAREGSRRVLRASALAAAFTILAVTLVPDIATAVMAVVFLGAAVGGMDVAMNASAVAAERAQRRAIMSSCHGFWSLGGLVGAGAGGWLIERLGVPDHALIVTGVALVLVVAAWPLVLDDGPDKSGARGRVALPLTPLPWLIGIMALMAMIPEGAVLDWGALYLRAERDGTITQSGFVFGAFSAAMALLRFMGDGVRERFGPVATMRACALTAMAGLAVAGLGGNAALVIAGFAIAGIGLSNLVPIAFSAAGNLPGLAPGIGLSLVTFMGYSGALFAPTFLGFVGEVTGFGAIFTGLAVLLAVVLALSGLARHAARDG
ncbi:MAG: MFS transporter [Alphaproteobacteria bacterium]|nr:MAG: MFS transporter [Alphaproteobacteria bacterium]